MTLTLLLIHIPHRRQSRRHTPPTAQPPPVGPTPTAPPSPLPARSQAGTPSRCATQQIAGRLKPRRSERTQSKRWASSTLPWMTPASTPSPSEGGGLQNAVQLRAVQQRAGSAHWVLSAGFLGPGCGQLEWVGAVHQTRRPPASVGSCGCCAGCWSCFSELGAGGHQPTVSGRRPDTLVCAVA